MKDKITIYGDWTISLRVDGALRTDTDNETPLVLETLDDDGLKRPTYVYLSRQDALNLVDLLLTQLHASQESKPGE